MVTKEEARYQQDEGTFKKPDFRTYCNKNFGGFPQELSETGLRFYRVKQENYLKWIKEEKIETIEIKREYVMPQRIKKLLESGKLWDNIVIDELDKKHKGDINAKEIIFLCALGRLVKNKKPYSFNTLISAPSSAGKDNLITSVLKLFPKEDIERFGRISRTTLNYLHSLDTEPDYNYNGKIIYLPEIEENILNSEVMKEFTSNEEEISKVAITKDKKREVEIKEVRGHPVIFSSTATTTPVEEIRTRFNIIGLDLSEEQIERTFIAEEEEYSEEIIDFILNLNSYEVEIPKKLFNFIKKNFPKNKQRHKRDFKKLLDFVKAKTLFNQQEREQTENILRAEPEDYNSAKEVFINSYSGIAELQNILKSIDKKIIAVLEKEEDKSLTATEILDSAKTITKPTLYEHLKHLEILEIINKIEDTDVFNHRTSKYELSEEFKDKKPFKLPLYDEE